MPGNLFSFSCRFGQRLAYCRIYASFHGTRICSGAVREIATQQLVKSVHFCVVVQGFFLSYVDRERFTLNLPFSGMCHIVYVSVRPVLNLGTTWARVVTDTETFYKSSISLRTSLCSLMSWAKTWFDELFACSFFYVYVLDEIELT